MKMHKITRYTIILLILIQTLTVATLPITKATTLQKGVIPGDYFTYGKFQIYISDPTAPINLFQDWLKFQNLKEIKFKIATPTTNPSLIYFNQTITFTSNDTVKELNGAVDISSGDSQGAQGTLFFISAGLGKDDFIYPQSQNFTFTINETRKDPYWPERDVCVFNITTKETQESMIILTRTIIKWDKQTGALLALGETKGGGYVGQPAIVDGTVSYRLVATNRFTVPQEEGSGSGDITLYIAITLIFIAALTVIIIRYSRTTPKKKWKRLKNNKK